MVKRLLIVGVVALLALSCSTKEREEGKHAMSDELEAIDKAKAVQGIVDSVYKAQDSAVSEE